MDKFFLLEWSSKKVCFKKLKTVPFQMKVAAQTILETNPFWHFQYAKVLPVTRWQYTVWDRVPKEDTANFESDTFLFQKLKHFWADSEYLGKINTKKKLNFFFNV